MNTCTITTSNPEGKLALFLQVRWRLHAQVMMLCEHGTSQLLSADKMHCMPCYACQHRTEAAIELVCNDKHLTHSKETAQPHTQDMNTMRCSVTSVAMQLLPLHDAWQRILIWT